MRPGRPKPISSSTPARTQPPAQTTSSTSTTLPPSAWEWMAADLCDRALALVREDHAGDAVEAVDSVPLVQIGDRGAGLAGARVAEVERERDGRAPGHREDLWCHDGANPPIVRGEVLESRQS